MDNAFEKARQAYGTGAYDDATLEFLFPQLKESENERIRKWIYNLVENLGYPADEAAEKELEEMQPLALAWLEKQKEHQNNSDAPNESSWSGMISSSDKDKNLDEIAQEYVDSVKQYNQEPTWDLMQTAVCYGYHLAEQKEQKLLSTEETELNSIAFLEQMGYTCIPPGKEQKSVEWEWPNLSNCIRNCKKCHGKCLYRKEPCEEQKLAEKQNYSELNDFERAILRGFLSAGVENVPATIIKETAKECLMQMRPIEWSKEETKVLDSIIDDYEKAAKSFFGYDGKIMFLKAIRNGEYGLSKQKWSEEDKDILLSIKCVIDSVWHNFDYDCSKEELKEMWNWLDVLWQKVEYPQPKQEWSEEDKSALGFILSILVNEQQYNCAKGSSYYEAVESIKNWLKSLRPSWKPSEQEKGALRTAIHILTEERSFPKAARHLKAILDAFEGKESRKDWKPNEEQMQGLRRGIVKADKGSDAKNAMVSLYNDLEKL